MGRCLSRRSRAGPRLLVDEPRTNPAAEERPAGAAPERIPLGASDAGERLDRFLAVRVGISRAEARRLLADGQVVLDGRVCGYRDKGLALPGSGVLEVSRAKAADGLRVRASTEQSDIRGGVPADVQGELQGGLQSDDARHSSEVTAPLTILAEGPGWIAVDKPAGWPVHPLREDEVGTVLNAVALTHPEIQGVGDEGGLRSGVVHRLDVGTSGVLLFGTEEATWLRLRTGFREHRVEKIYRAVVAGQPDASIAPDDGSFGPELAFTLAVARHRPARVRLVDAQWRRAPRGYPARQRMRVVERFAGASLVEFEIATGFLHQIRVIAAHLGHPVLGDALYGDEAALSFGAPRQLLHAARLSFDEISAESPDPEDLRAMILRLRLGEPS